MLSSIPPSKIRCPNCAISEVVYRFNSDNFQIHFCKKCLNGFTYPVPKNLGRYYSGNYWQSSGFLGVFKNTIYKFFQIRRKYWIQKYLKNGNILDVGSGEGAFSKFFNNDFLVISLDTPSANIKNPNVLKVDFLKWNTKKKFDAIVFWESLEHTHSPQKYLVKASKLLKKRGLIFIEYPRADSLEAKLFGKYWFHLDPPRHLSHLTPIGLDKLLSKAKLSRVSHNRAFALEYTIGGFTGSILNVFMSHSSDFLKTSKNYFSLFLLIPMLLISAFIEIIFFILGQSPIYLTVARKSTT